jgi:tetratricopeptide (TPR) repeat protein
MLGILWFGRTQVRKALLYLLAVKGLYHKADKASFLITAEASFRKDLDYIYTHNLFYLAQAYGNLGDLKESSEYCKETLQRQLTAGLDTDIRGAFDWAKNCAGIADFFQSMGQYRHCAAALASAEKILSEKVMKKIEGGSQDVSVVEGSELEADIHRRWAVMDGKILKAAFDVEMAKRNTLVVGETWVDPFIDEEEEIIKTCSSSDVPSPPSLEQQSALENGVCLPPKPPIGIYIHLYMYIYLCIYKCTYTYIYIYIYKYI